ncbi:MAG: hypothetical protein IT353_03155 [Gemmatimonadaceae bacterium]|nr:hypothetical protein [Gemmatimonadaceae bacterium]
MTRVVWYARPGVVLSILLFLVILTALFAKTPTAGRQGDPRLLSTSTDPMGAALFFELTERLGYRAQRERTLLTRIPPRAIVTALDPVEALSPAYVHLLLEHVRAGGALLTVLGRFTDALSDSIDIDIAGAVGTTLETRAGVAKPCDQQSGLRSSGFWFGAPTLRALAVTDSVPASWTTFIYVKGARDEGTRVRTPAPALIGLPFGRGRLVVAGDPDVLRNDALRDCSFGLDLPAVAALSYLSEDEHEPRRTIVFDDYHLRRIRPVGLMDVVSDYLVSTGSGRTFLQIGVAGLLLLLAMAPRMLPPRRDQWIARRSPLEHVDALARAYLHINATRTGVTDLVRGLERRVGASAQSAGRSSPPSHESFLAHVAESTPSVAADVAVVRRALTGTVTTAEFIEVGNALARIEHTLTHR